MAGEGYSYGFPFPYGGFYPMQAANFQEQRAVFPEPPSRESHISPEALALRSPSESSLISGSGSSPEEPRPGPSGAAETASNKTRWNDPEVFFLLYIWEENMDFLESKEARKAWIRITDRLNQKFKKGRTVVQVQRKIKYLKEKYKEAKDWNRRQTGGNRKTSPFYDKIDAVLGTRALVTFNHVVESGNEGDVQQESPISRTERKKNKRKRPASPTSADEDFGAEGRREFVDTMKDVKAQGDRMTTAMEGLLGSIERSQAQQTETMNMLLRAILNNQSTNSQE